MINAIKEPNIGQIRCTGVHTGEYAVHTMHKVQLTTNGIIAGWPNADDRAKWFSE